METTALKVKIVTCIGFDMQINFYCLWHISAFTASLWFKPRATMLFKRMKTTEYILATNMKISKNSDIGFMKNLRIQNVEKILCVFSNVIFKSCYVDSQPRKSLVWKFTIHRVVWLKLVNLLPLNSYWDRLAICWITMK